MLEEFEEKGVKAVVRLNKKLYDRNHFLERGIQHIESKFTTNLLTHSLGGSMLIRGGE